MQRSPAHHRPSGVRVAVRACTRGLVGACRLAIPAALAGLAGVGVAFNSPIAQGQPAPDYGFEWRTIRDPGNPAASGERFPGFPRDGIPEAGRVDYEFRLTRTEITATQWLEFVDAYSRFNPVQGSWAASLGGRHLIRIPDTGDPRGYRWEILADALDAAADMGWWYAARYCNWLHNGKVNEAWAFETGAYDSATWTADPTNPYGGQVVRSPGAMFWIPNLDEWTKAMHWDPNKLGPGLGDYWLYPNASDTPPVGGLPGTPGAQTGAGVYDDGGSFRIYPVGSYPNAQSPWGLLDGSGGVTEWLEGAFPNGVRPARGSQNVEYSADIVDRIDYVNGLTPEHWGFGLRVASVVPVPGVVSIAGVAVVLYSRRRRMR